MAEKPSLLKQCWLRRRALRKARAENQRWWSCWPADGRVPTRPAAGRQAGQQPPPPTAAPSTTPLTRAGSELGEKVNPGNGQKYGGPAMRARVPVLLASFLLVAGNRQKQRKSGNRWFAGGCRDGRVGRRGRPFWHSVRAVVFGGEWKVPVSSGCHHSLNVTFIGRVLTRLPQRGEHCTPSPVFSDAHGYLHSYSSHTSHTP